jgi:preprotein translocase subunit SecY
MIPLLKQLYQEEGEMAAQKFSSIHTHSSRSQLRSCRASASFLSSSVRVLCHSSLQLQFGVNLLVITAGSILLMWIGELISEFGLGNGVSYSSLLVSLHACHATSASPLSLSMQDTDPALCSFLAAGSDIAAVVLSARPSALVPVTYAKQVRGMKFFGGSSTYLPLRLNQAGVIPIIFALSLLLDPTNVCELLCDLFASILR